MHLTNQPPKKSLLISSFINNDSCIKCPNHMYSIAIHATVTNSWFESIIFFQCPTHHKKIITVFIKKKFCISNLSFWAFKTTINFLLKKKDRTNFGHLSTWAKQSFFHLKHENNPSFPLCILGFSFWAFKTTWVTCDNPNV